MLTRKTIAAAWNISPQMAGRYMKQGCPVDSIEAADRWRRANVMVRGSKVAARSEVCISPDEADDRAETMILESGSADRETLQTNLRTLQNMVRQCQAAIAAAIEAGDTEAGRRWTLTLTNVMHRNAIVAKELQAVLREDRVTMRFDEAEALFVGCVKQMRQVVLQAVDSLPHKVNPTDPQLAREALHEWVHGVFMRQMHAGLDSSGTDEM